MKYFMVIFLSLLMTGNIFALGRFFISPEQRQQLEQKTILSSSPTIQAEQVQKLQLNGFVKPKHGVSTIWVNGKTRVKTKQKDYYIRHWISPGHQISIDLQGNSAQLSPGQTLDIYKQVITETAYPVHAQKGTPFNIKKLQQP